MNQNASQKIFTLIRGERKRAVFLTLALPRTPKQVLDQVSQQFPKMTLFDLRRILRDFEKKHLIRALTPSRTNGCVYIRDDLSANLPFPIEAIELYSKIVRASIRQKILLTVVRYAPVFRHPEKPLTATQVRKELRDSYPMCLSHVAGALNFLHQHQLVEVIDYTEKRDLKIYGATELGKQFCQLLDRVSTEEAKENNEEYPTR